MTLKNYLSIACIILLLTAFGIMYNHQDYYYKSILKDKERDTKDLQHFIDSLSKDKIRITDTITKYVHISHTIEKQINYSKHQIDSLMNIWQPNRFDTIQYNNCKFIVEKQTALVNKQTELIVVKDSIIANQEVSIGDGSEIIKQQRRQISDVKDMLATATHEERNQRIKAKVNRVETIAGIVLTFFLTFKLLK